MTSSIGMLLTALIWFGVIPLDTVPTMTERTHEAVVRETLRPLALEWERSEDRVLDALRASFGERARVLRQPAESGPPARLALVGADDHSYYMGLATTVGDRPSDGMSPREARTWLVPPAPPGPVMIRAGHFLHLVLYRDGLPATHGLSTAQLMRALDAARRAVAGAMFRGVAFEDVEGVPHAVVRIVARRGDRRGMTLAEMNRMWGDSLDAEVGDDLLFSLDSGRLLAVTLRAIAGRHTLYTVDGLERGGETALRAVRTFADGARPSDPPRHTAAAGIPPERWRALRPGSTALVADLPGEQAEAAWAKLAAAAADTGWHPVVIGPLMDAVSMNTDGAQFADAGLAYGWHYTGTPTSALAAATALTLDDYLKRYGAELTDLPTAENPPQGRAHPWPIARSPTAVTGDARPGHAAASHHRRVYMLLVPADAPWTVPAWLATYTAGEATPSNTALVLLARHLNRKYGAVVFGGGSAAVSFRLPKPPTAEGVATLHTLCRRICPDMFGDVSAFDFAAARAAGDDLYFWWD